MSSGSTPRPIGVPYRDAAARGVVSFRSTGIGAWGDRLGTAYESAGTYTVTVTASDEVDNTASETRTIVIE
jgi:hypothetical protein